MKKFFVFVVILAHVSVASADTRLDLRLDVNSLRIFEMCSGKFIEYMHRGVVDESWANRDQHLVAGCAMAEAGYLLGFSSWQSNALATFVVFAQENLNKHPNMDEVVFGWGLNTLADCRIYAGTTIDLYTRMSISCQFD
jgi:hypothetical protein